MDTWCAKCAGVNLRFRVVQRADNQLWEELRLWSSFWQICSREFEGYLSKILLKVRTILDLIELFIIIIMQNRPVQCHFCQQTLKFLKQATNVSCHYFWSLLIFIQSIEVSNFAWESWIRKCDWVWFCFDSWLSQWKANLVYLNIQLTIWINWMISYYAHVNCTI